MEKPLRRNVDILGGGGGGRGRGVGEQLWSGVVPGDRKSGEVVGLGMGHRHCTQTLDFF